MTSSDASFITTSTSTALSCNEAEEWKQAERWVCEQVLVTFRHRAIASRLLMPHYLDESEHVLRIVLPPEFISPPTQKPAEPWQNSAPAECAMPSNTVRDVREKLKRMEQLQDIDCQLTLRRRRRWQKVFHPRAKSAI